MAEAAKPNHIKKEDLEAFLDRYEAVEDEAQTMISDMMNKVKNGPRADQKAIRQEMKEAGVRMKTFNALWGVRMEARKSAKKIAELEDDDLDQLREFATAMKGTPMGEMIQARLDDPAF
jgi:uncharacterized protein (UPF0335 family)